MNDKKKSFKKNGFPWWVSEPQWVRQFFAATNEPVWLAVGVCIGCSA